MDKQKQYLLIATAVVVGLVLIITYLVFAAVQRSGKIEVTIASSPDDATLFVDDKEVSSGTNYLEPGLHTFAATKDGWTDVEFDLEISEDVNQANLILGPASPEAEEWLSGNQREATKREAFAGINAQLRGLATRNQNPLINKLPRSDLTGPYKIDYGFDSRDEHLFLLISYSSTDGRQKAVDWLRSEGYKMSELDVEFTDFINPLASELSYE